MKLALSLAIFLFFNTVFAQDFNEVNGTYNVTEYTWCNAPLFQETPGSCTTSNWNGVDLDQIKTFKLNFSNKKQMFSMTDEEGNSWHHNLKKCDVPPHKQAGCRARIKEDGEKLSLYISQWGHQFSQRLTITIEDEKISVYTPDDAYVVYTVDKK